jgi:hypothetical protein
LGKAVGEGAGEEAGIPPAGQRVAAPDRIVRGGRHAETLCNCALGRATGGAVLHPAR